MKKIFIGLLLVFLDFNINFPDLPGTLFSGGSLNLLPDFVGFLLIILGLRQWQAYGVGASRLYLTTKIMFVYTLLIFFLDLIGYTARMSSGFVIVLGVISSVLALLISYDLTRGVREFEEMFGQGLNSHSLFLAWRWMTLATVFSYLLLPFAPLAYAFIIITLILNILFLLNFNTTRKVFAMLRERGVIPGPDEVNYSHDGDNDSNGEVYEGDFTPVEEDEPKQESGYAQGKQRKDIPGYNEDDDYTDI